MSNEGKLIKIIVWKHFYSDHWITYLLIALIINTELHEVQASIHAFMKVMP